mmetsp:Transcript_86754/g.153644  ORF Transcript_86754/g.153644 Transcript_86754/m.153644 type:complete len:215 (-) Transcript_86754:2159-2803(-)
MQMAAAKDDAMPGALEPPSLRLLAEVEKPPSLLGCTRSEAFTSATKSSAVEAAESTARADSESADTDDSALSYPEPFSTIGVMPPYSLGVLLTERRRLLNQSGCSSNSWPTRKLPATSASSELFWLDATPAPALPFGTTTSPAAAASALELSASATVAFKDMAVFARQWATCTTRTPGSFAAYASGNRMDSGASTDSLQGRKRRSTEGVSSTCS